MTTNSLFLAVVNDGDTNLIWVIVGVLAIIALFLYIIRR
jgi:hypothetical protein